ncbi:MAG: hypothetical protein DMG07_06390 [Acidobacteria bacterium]|nr:MAG: hypothetical protein DMG07_06390 [Acidobacteriota bacterium]
MKGDFSRWYYLRRDNFNGILPQQGRVLLDADGVAQTRITNDWQDLDAQDTIGAGVAAVPASLPDSFRVDRARVQAGNVIVTLEPGRVWADGILLHLAEPAAVDRSATYLLPPIQNPPGTVASIAAGVRDAVVLEVWREAVNGFQLPDILIEPGLGGVDTAERVHTASALRLYRMAAGDDCESIRSKLADDFSSKGKLKVTLQPTVAIGGDCPVVEGGGYTGFEHQTYRIEIAETTAGTPSFKFSRFNGGLVGRGVFDAGGLRVNITANLAAINTSGLAQFYLEAEEFDAQRGHWRVTYGAPVTLNATNQLVLPAAPTFGAIPVSPNPVFFRLWDGIRPIAGFPISATPAVLDNGIRLEFEAAATGKYVPKDYWVFIVRAAGVGNPQVLVNSEPPLGIHYARVPLAEVTWNAAQDVTLASGGIEDCREPFQPLTRLSTCCTYRVGDGVHSHGQFTSIQAAINALPASGGEICVLPGVYTEAVEILKRRSIRLHGCGARSRIVAPAPVGNAAPLPALHVRDSRGIRIDSLAAEAQPQGVGVLLDNTGFDLAPGMPQNRVPKLHDIKLLDLQVTASARSAIEARNGQFIEIGGCDIRMKDLPSGWPGIFFLGDDGVIERNQVRVRSERQVDASEPTFPVPAGSGLGGIQIGGTSDRVRIIDNIIQGGIGNGITLGSVIVVDSNGRDTGVILGWVVNVFDPCNPCKPGTVVFPPPATGEPTRTISAGALTEIRIERNRIYDMGLDGIGVVAFFDLQNLREAIEVDGLSILGNHIRGCLRREIEAIPAAMLNRIGYGGIALAAVEDLVVWDNVIEDNGPRRIEPVCGIYVLIGTGVDISRNYIVNNGARTGEPAASAKPGQRGGIVIQNAQSPRRALQSAAGAAAAPVTVQSDVPALRVHDNIVVAPLGLALSATVLGATSVVANQFVSQGVGPTRLEAFQAYAVGAVSINNLGRTFETAGYTAGYANIGKGNYQPDAGYSFTGGAFTLSRGAAGLKAVNRILGGGLVLFAANQVTLDLIEAGATFGGAAILIVSLDDVGFLDNQATAQLADDFLLVNTVLFGSSVRASDNRWQEPVARALYSALTFGFMNVTAQNTATHCIVAFAPPKLLVSGPNVILLNQYLQDPCADPARLLANFGQAAGGG